MQHGGRSNNNSGIGGGSRRVAGPAVTNTGDPLDTAVHEYYDAWPAMTHPNIFGQQPQNTSHLAQWVQDRQKAFHDFQSNSLIQPPASLFSRDWTPPREPLFTPPRVQPLLTPPRGPLLTTLSRPRNSEQNLELANDYPKMLTNAEPLNPKAKVSYDEGQFTVEIPLHEYTVSTN